MSGTASHYLRRLVEQNPELLKRGGIFRRSAVHESADWLRIVSLPSRDVNLDLVPDLTPLFQRPGGTMRLWPIQSLALLEAERCQGAFLAVPVGGGKSLTAALMPEALQSQLTVILVPAQLKKRTLQSVYPELSKHFVLPLDRIRVVSYNELERAPGDVLDRLQPDVIVADEAHYLKHSQAARTARFMRYLKEHPDTRLVVMSGTLTQKSILDYAHLIKRALREGSPLPNYYGHLVEWAEALDVSEDPRPPGSLLRLCERKEHRHDDSGRNHFACRLHRSSGVISLAQGFRGTALIVRKRDIEAPPSVVAALERLRKTWIIGNPEAPEESKEEILDDLTFARFARQLACGFYLKWQWRDGVRDLVWLDRRAAWNRSVRYCLRYLRKPGLDSPLLVANAAHRGELAKEYLESWRAWSEVKARKQPPSVAVWIDKYMVEDAVRWASADGAPGIVWYEHKPLGKEISKALREPLYDTAADIVMDGRPLVLSMNQFGTGVDGLQTHYDRMLFTSVPNGRAIEQCLGRLHREGQNRTVVVDMLLPTIETEEKLTKTFAQARYMAGTGFGAQKLLTATLEGINAI